MSRAAALRVAAATLVWLGGCGGGSESGVATSQADAAWTDYAAVRLDAQGQTPELSLPWSADRAGLVVEVSSPSQRCMQVDALSDDAGHAYIARAESGPYCIECEQRASAVSGAGRFVFPSRAGPFMPTGALRFRFGLRDCDTLTRAAPPSIGETLFVRARSTRAPPPRGTLALRLVVTPASVFHAPASDTAINALLDALNVELAGAQLSARWVAVTRLPAGATSDALFSRADPSALQALLAQDPSTQDGVAVVLAGCLQLSEPALRRTSEPQGYTPHIPGGAGPADGVFIQGSLCGTPGPVRIEWSASAMARVIAHELGHYLGLYHSVEADGSTDQLEDTGAANLMFYRPSDSTAQGLSPTQGEVVRAHPAVGR